jgi:hypothetical protein
VLVRGTEWRPSSTSWNALLLLARRSGEEKEESLRRQEAVSLFKRDCSSAAGAASILVSLADRGGEKEDMTGSAAPAKDLHLRETLENSLPVAISKRQTSAVAAIPGQMGGLAMLIAIICASSFFLFVRIFCSCVSATKPPTQPSGLVPGCGWGGAVSSLLCAGGLQGSDCVSAIFIRVCSKFVKGLCVIFYFSWVLLVISHPPLE